MSITFPTNSLQTPLRIPSGAHRPRLTFIGVGYLGSTYAICFAELGYEVLGVDVDANKIATLASGEVPIHEPGLDELLRKNLSAGRLRFTTDYAEAAEFGDVHFICVGTPQRPDGMAADLSYVEKSVASLAPHLTRKALIVGKSTVPVGTAEWVEQLVGKHAPADLGVEVAWSPEFLREGYAVEDVIRPDRVVFGVKTEWARDMLYAAHKGSFDLAANEDREVPVVITDFATAELVKVAANAFLATKISFINAMAEVCDAAHADVTQLARAIGYDARIGNKFLRAGVGFGGGCLPKDIRAFQARAQELGVGEALRFLHEVDLINQRRRQKVVEIAAEMLGPSGRTGRSRSGRLQDRSARRELQAQLRRHPRLTRALGVQAPFPDRCRRVRLRPGSHGQRRARAARRDLREVADRRGRGRRSRLRADRLGRVPLHRTGRAGRVGRHAACHRRDELPRCTLMDKGWLGLPRHGSIGTPSMIEKTDVNSH